MTEDEARRLAATLHAGQVDKIGHPYIAHLERVVHNLKTRWPDATADEVVAAWLHDAIEHTDTTGDALLAAAVPPDAVNIVQAVSRPRDADYMDWIADMASHAETSAIRVKLADNQDNIEAVRAAALPDGAKKMATQYEPARRLLEQSLAEATRK